MNHFVSNTLSALSYHISRKSFLVVKKWRDQELFWLIIKIFSSPAFKSLEKEEQKKIYGYIDELRISELDREEKMKWLIICLEQLESVEVKNSDHLSLSRTLNKK